jgi:hypothetical protein
MQVQQGVERQEDLAADERTPEEDRRTQSEEKNCYSPTSYSGH